MTRKVIEHYDDWASMRAQFRWNVPKFLNIAERCCDSWAAIAPDRVAIRHVGDGVQEWTYGQLKAASDGLAQSLAAQGVGRGDRVAVLLAQCPEVLITHFAVQKLGAVILPLFTLFGEDALAYRLQDSGAVALISDRANIDKVVGLKLPQLRWVYAIDGAPAPVLDFYEEIAKARGAFVAEKTLAEDPATLIYTSGTTGPPKGVLHAHRFLLGHLPSIEVTHREMSNGVGCGWTPADWAWIGGLMDMAIPCLYFGVPLLSHRMRKFEADEALRFMNVHNAQNLFMPPTALKMMRDATIPRGLQVQSITSGGESLGADLLHWAKDKLGAPISEIYGQTECNLVLASAQGVVETRPGAMGKPVPGMEIEIVGDDGLPMRDGEIGEIAVRKGTPVMFKEYWKNPDKTSQKFRGDWLLTGDLGTRDRDGYFSFVARDDDVITSAGYRIGPSEIEHCLASHPDVVMAAAVGVPDELRTEVVKAFVVLRQGASPDGLAPKLQELVRNRISPHVAPRSFEFIDTLPMTATGKVRRKELRER